MSTDSADDETALGAAAPEHAETPTGAEWFREYARDHVAHLLVVAFLGVYPIIFSLLTSTALGAEFEAVLPRTETMVAVFYFGLFAMSFDFISGYTGYLSFGHAAFYGTGGYFVILVANGKLPLLPADTPFVVSLLLAGVLAAALAVLIGSVSFRLSGVYFAMITLGFAQVLYVLMRDWDFVGSNPSDGVAVAQTHPEGFNVGVPWIDQLNLAIGSLRGDEIQWLFLDLGGTEVSYYMVGLVVLVCYLAMQRMVHSPFGRVLVAIRENEERARAVGYDTFRYKLAAFAISGFFAGIAGGLFAGFRRAVSPDNSLYFLVTGDALLASIIGGFGTLAGPLYGRLFDRSVREFLSKTGGGGGLLPMLRKYVPSGVLETPLVGGMTIGQGIETFLNGHAALYLGLVFVVFVLYVPGGLLGWVRDRLGGTVAKRLPNYLANLRR